MAVSAKILHLTIFFSLRPIFLCSISPNFVIQFVNAILASSSLETSVFAPPKEFFVLEIEWLICKLKLDFGQDILVVLFVMVWALVAGLVLTHPVKPPHEFPGNDSWARIDYIFIWSGRIKN